MTPPSSPPQHARRAPAAAARRTLVHRVLLGTTLLGSALTLVAAIPSGPQRPDPPVPGIPASTRTAAGQCPQGDFTSSVLCWGEAVGRGRNSVIVTISAPQSLPEKDGLAAVSAAVPKLRDKLIVIVPDGVRTGSGGTFLLALASQRIVGQHSSVSPLTDDTHRQLRDLAGCPPDGFCDAVHGRPRSGYDLVEAGLAQDGNTSLFTAGPAEVTTGPSAGQGSDDKTSGALGSEDSSDNLTLLLFVCAVLVCLLTALVVLVRRTNRTAGPAQPATAATSAEARTEPPPGPRHTAATRPSAQQAPPATRADPGHAAPGEPDGHTTAASPAATRQRPADRRSHPHLSATVRTVLRPQGYVDINGLLYRASWGGRGEPPAPGQQVEVVQGRTGELTVFGLGATGGGPHGDDSAPLG
ncbi:hypothetical protein ACIBVL_06535 [Streptomyces sp. NPDC049687]|uniref:hypothetical protein n=1 Tax=Streptomyces sp. NPDC049687 TaxID=3365596 RepID=UPI00379E6FE7